MAGIGLGLAVAAIVGYYALEKVAEDRAVEVAQRAVQQYLNRRSDSTDNRGVETPRSDQDASVPQEEDIDREED